MPHECMVSIRSNACIRANQMGAFVPIKCMHLYVTNAGSRVQGTGRAGNAPLCLMGMRYVVLKPRDIYIYGPA